MRILDEIAPRYAPIDTPAGPGFMAYTAGGVVMLSTDYPERRFVEEVTDLLGARPIRHDPPSTFLKRVRASIARGDGSAVDWARIRPFQRRVLEATAAIPPGSVRSYGDIADLIGAPRAQRAVGTALARNPVPLLVPCHRVVRGDGTLGNYGMGGTKKKEALLRAEGYTATARGATGLRTTARRATGGRTAARAAAGARSAKVRRTTSPV